MKRFFLITTAFLISSVTLYAQVDVGEEAPGFTLTSLDTVEVSLSDYEGKVVFLYMFGATCPYCRSNRDNIEADLYQAFKEDTNFVALGMDTWNQSVSNVQDFKADKITFTLLLQGESVAVSYYGIDAYDRGLVVGADGLLKYKGSQRVSGDEITNISDAITAALENVNVSAEREPLHSPSFVSLGQNYPNPFNPVTSITYTLNKPSEVSLKVYNVLGKEIATLVNTSQPAGEYTVRWNATSSAGAQLPSGVYIYQMQANEQILTKKMTLIK